MEEYLKAYKLYYTLKEQYDIKYDNYKKKIKRKNISNAQKKELLKNPDIKCINCKKKGGNIFSEKDRTLKLICGHKKPCSLNITLMKNNSIQFPKQLNKHNSEKIVLENDIIKTKLEILFDLEDKDVGLGEFKKTKENLTTINNKIRSTQNKIFEIKSKNIKVPDPSVKTKDGDKDVKMITKRISHEVYLANLENKMNKLMNKYNNLIKDYHRPKLNEPKNKELLKDAFALYNEEIKPLKKEYYDVKYDNIFITEHVVKCEKGVVNEHYHIEKQLNSVEKLSEDREFKIISNKK